MLDLKIKTKPNSAVIYRKGSILLIASWVLAILVVFALSLGHRAQIALKLSRYQKDSFNAYCLAKSGINRAIYELEQDVNDYDALSESWSDNEKIFSKISPDENSTSFCTISYLDADGRRIFGVTDEENKININLAGAKVIESLFEESGFSEDAKEISEFLKQWVSSSVEADEDKKIFKNAPLATREELVTALEYFYKDFDKAEEVYSKIKTLITVYGDGTLNINTTSEEILSILSAAYAETNEEKNAAMRLSEDVIKFREKNGFLEDITSIASAAGFDVNELSLWDKINSFLGVKSNYFNIKAQVSAREISKQIEVVFSRSKEKIVYWHQN